MNHQVAEMFYLNSVWVPGTGAVSGATYNSIKFCTKSYIFSVQLVSAFRPCFRFINFV